MSKTPLPDYSQLARWTVNDVCTWLMENRFGSYVSQFREHGIDGGRFAGLKDVDLSQMRCPLNKRTDLLKCIRGIPNRDVNPPIVSSFVPSSRAPPPPRTEDRRNKQLPPQNDVQSDSDDDYEAWGEFDDFDEGSSDEDYENNENQRNIEDGLEPQEDYANYEPDQMEEGGSVTKNGHSITDSLRQALEKRNRVTQERPPLDEPAIPPRPARPGRTGNVPAPQRSPAPPRQGRRGRDMIPTPEPEDQPTYEDPDETDHAPPPIVGRRPPPQRPMEPLPQTHSDMPEDVYEDPDQTPTPAAPKRTMPPVPRHKEQSLARTISEPDQPAPPPPRHGNDRHRKLPPPQTSTLLKDEESDDSNSSDYEKPEPTRPSLPAVTKPRQKGLPPRPPEDDYMAMAEKAKKSDDEEEDYEKPDPADLPPGSRYPPTPAEPKSGLKSKGRPPPMPSQTESGKKLPAGAVPIIGIQPEVIDSPKLKHSSRDDAPPPVPSSRTPHRGSQDEEIPPAVPTSRPHGRPPLVKEGRSLPPTPSHHRGPIETPSSNKNQVRDSVIDRPPPPIPGNEGDITQQPWYQNVNRAEADVVLKNYGKNGTFLIRPSTKAGQPYTLQIYNDLKVYNLPIRQKADSTYALGREKRAEETFKEVQDLVEFFKKHTLILAAGGSGQTRLKYNCPKI